MLYSVLESTDQTSNMMLGRAPRTIKQCTFVSRHGTQAAPRRHTSIDQIGCICMYGVRCTPANTWFHYQCFPTPDAPLGDIGRSPPDSYTANFTNDLTPVLHSTPHDTLQTPTARRRGISATSVLHFSMKNKPHMMPPTTTFPSDVPVIQSSPGPHRQPVSLVVSPTWQPLP